MEEDYLATNMKAALAKLQTALRVCGKDKCSKQTVAQTYSYLATVYAAGTSQKEDAVEAFKQMLRIDPTMTPDSNYLTGEVQSAFDEAKKALGAGGVALDRPVSVLSEKPWTEQAIGTPVPVYVETPAGVEASRVLVRYKAPGIDKWEEVELKEHTKGWGGYIPCKAVQRPGELVYFVTAFDANLDRVASAGSAKNPRKVQLSKAIEGRQPALPSATPPTPCPRPEERLSCETSDDCPGTMACVDLACVEESSIVDPDAELNAKRKKNWVGIGFSPDVMLINSQAGVCDAPVQDDGQYSCFFGTGKQFDPNNYRPIQAGTTNQLNGGFAPGSMRVLVAYDRVIGTRMVPGIRLGFAFLGHPERNDGKKFLPYHAEARFAFHFTKDPFVSTGVRPYAFVNGGLSESVGKIVIPVTYTTDGTDELTSDIEVYQKGGPFFGGLGGGVQYAVAPQAALVLEVAGRAMLPTFAVVIAPTLGFTYGF